MANYSVDNLEIEIKSNSDKATASINKLTKAFQDLSKALGVDKLKTASSELKNVSSGIDDVGLRDIQKRYDTVINRIKALTKERAKLQKASKNTSKISQQLTSAKSERDFLFQSGQEMALPQDFGDIATKKDILRVKIAQVKSDLKDALGAEVQNPKKIAALTQEYQNLNQELKKVKQYGKGIVKQTVAMFMRSVKLRAVNTAVRVVVNSLKEGLSNLYQWSKLGNGRFAPIVDNASNAILRFKNSLASAMAPIIEKALPLITQLIDAFARLNDKLAQGFAFLTGQSTYYRYLTDATKEYTTAAKAAKSTTLGFDELNIISEDFDSGTNGNYGDMFEIADLDKSAKWWAGIIAAAGIVGGIIASWKISQAFSSALDTLTDLSKGKKIAIGLTMMITGLAVEASGMYNIGKGDASTKNIIKSAIGAALGIAGSLIVFGTGPLGWAIGIGATLTVGIASLILGYKAKKKAEWEASAYGKIHAEIQKKLDEVSQESYNIKVRLGEITGEIDADTMANLSTARGIIEEIFTLDGMENKTAIEIDIIKRLISELNGLGLPNVQLQFDDLTGRVKGSKQAILETIDALEREYQLEAYKEAYVATLREQANAEKNYTEALEAQKAAQHELNVVTERANFVNDERTRLSEYVTWLEDQELQYTEEYRAEYEKLTEETIPNLNKEYKELTKTKGEFQEQVDEANKTLKESESVYSAATKEAEYWRDKTVSYAQDVSSAIRSALDAAKNLKFDSTSLMSDEEIFALKGVKGYASGGHPTSGQLFLANEGSAPEMVGRIGGKTTVATNDDIVKAVSSGVYNAVVSAMSQNNGGSFNLYIDGKQVRAAVNKANKNAGATIATGGLVYG